jgi:hypothetical protein
VSRGPNLRYPLLPKPTAVKRGLSGRMTPTAPRAPYFYSNRLSGPHDLIPKVLRSSNHMTCLTLIATF